MSANIFFIATAGSSASFWLAKVLSLHPKIHAFHSNESVPEPASHEYPYFSQPSELIDRLSQLAQSETCFIGAVHIYPWHDATMKSIIEQHGGAFSGVLRNPLYRINSLHTHKVNLEMPVSRYGKQISFLIKFYSGLLGALSTKHVEFWMKLSTKHVEFLWNVHCVLSTESELLDLPKKYIFKYEDIVVDREEFSRLVAQISEDQIECDESYLDEVFNYGKVNPHHAEVPESIHDIYFGAWDNIQRYLFDVLMEYYDIKCNVKSKYTGVGYDIFPKQSN